MTAIHALEKAKNRHLACAAIGIVAGSSIHKTYVHSMQHHLGDLLDFGGKSVFRLDPDETARQPYFSLFRSDATYDGTERANLNNVLRYGVKPMDTEKGWNGLIMAPQVAFGSDDSGLKASEAARKQSTERWVTPEEQTRQFVGSSPAVAPKKQTPAARKAAPERVSGGAMRHSSHRHSSRSNPNGRRASNPAKTSSVVDEVFAEFELRQLRLRG